MSEVRPGPLTIWVLARPDDRAAQDGLKVRCKRLQPGSCEAELRISAVRTEGLVSEVRPGPLTIWILARPDDRTAQDGPKVRCKRLQPGWWGDAR